MLKPIVSAKAKCFLLKTEPHVFSVDNLDSLPNKIGQWRGGRTGVAAIPGVTVRRDPRQYPHQAVPHQVRSCRQVCVSAYNH